MMSGISMGTCLIELFGEFFPQISQITLIY